MAAAIREKKMILLLSTLYQQWLQRAPGARMYCALFEQGPGEKLKDSWKDSHSGVRGLDPTLGVCDRQKLQVHASKLLSCLHQRFAPVDRV